MIDFAEVSDDSLIRSLAFSNINAFKLLYHRYYDPLYIFIATRVETGELIESIILEVFISIWDDRKQTCIYESFDNYLNKLAESLIEDISLAHGINPKPVDQHVAIPVEFDIESIWNKIQTHISAGEDKKKRSLFSHVVRIFRMLLFRVNSSLPGNDV